MNNLKNKKNKMKNKNKVTNKEDKKIHIKLRVVVILLHLKDVWKLCKEWSDKINKIRNIMNIDTIGKKEKNKEDLKDNYYQFGDLIIKRRRNMLLQFVGIQNIKIFSLFH